MTKGKWSEAQKRYASSEKGKLARKKYQESEKGRASRKAYMARRKAKLVESKQAKAITGNVPETMPEVVKSKKEGKSKK